MTKVRSRTDALEDISSWSCETVVKLLQKNGVEEACWKAVEKRQIDGDELLHLTEGKLALWKSDLTRPLIWNLWTFVEELKKCPENYVEDEQEKLEQEETLTIQPVETETFSDTGSWDTDFEDVVDDLNEINKETQPEIRKTTVNPDFRNSLRLFQENDRIKMENDARGSASTLNKIEKSTAETTATISESTYANCESLVTEPENTYANVGFADKSINNESSKNETKPLMSLAEKLKEQLLLRGALDNSTKPAISPKPESLIKRTRDEVILLRNEPRTSFLHKALINGNNNNVQKKPNTSVAVESAKNMNNNNNNTEETIRNLPKPPVSIRGFDLVANLPTRALDESEDDEEEDYEIFDEQVIEQHKRNSLVSRVDSVQSLSSNSIRQNSVESVYHPTSSVSHDGEEEEVYEIYESITESPEDNGHDYKIETKFKISTNPPPLPSKPPPNITMLHNQLSKTESKSERSLEKKSATLPHAGSNVSLNNAARPLPPPPDKQSYYDRPWFHNLTREQANLLIEEQCTYGNATDGYFLMRPSTSNPNNPLTLVLWCKDRVYNVPVRRRPDNRYALGSAKSDEQSFASIDEIIPFYRKEELVLYTGGVQTGNTKLTDTPPKEKFNSS